MDSLVQLKSNIKKRYISGKGKLMAQFIITYIGGDQPKTKEAGAGHMAQYQTWLASMGDVCISPMNPFGKTLHLGVF